MEKSLLMVLLSADVGLGNHCEPREAKPNWGHTVFVTMLQDWVKLTSTLVFQSCALKAVMMESSAIGSVNTVVIRIQEAHQLS
jgi:hypothetical protein